MELKNEDFSEKINVSACTLENYSHIFPSVSGKVPPGKSSPIKLPPGESLPENSHRENSHPVFKLFCI